MGFFVALYVIRGMALPCLNGVRLNAFLGGGREEGFSIDSNLCPPHVCQPGNASTQRLIGNKNALRTGEAETIEQHFC